MIEELVAAYGNRFLVAALGVSLALLCLFIVLWLLRKRAPSPFVRGGRNRQPRLQVLDAAAVDARRRLVLVRRDNVEHLVMIGGPTDIVIESGIGDERAYLSATPVSPSQTVPLTHEDRSAGREPVAISRPAAAIAAVRPEPELPASRPEPVAAPVRREQARQPAAPVKPIAEPVRTIAAAAEIEPALTRTPTAQPAPVAEAAPAAAPPSPAPIQPAAGPMLVKDDVTATTAPVTTPERPVLEMAAAPAPVEPQPEVPANRPPVTATTPVTPAEPLTAAVVQPIEATATTAPTQDDDLSLAPADAADILEAARGRVMPELAETAAAEPERAPETQPSPEEPKADEAPKQRIPSDFERVLEEEMERHLAATTAATPAPAADIPPAPAIRPERPVGVPPVVGASKPAAAGNRPAEAAEEPSLQKEIARIFGEMSASRDG
ncbi:flagellar biosynthetic protein FliO [Ciceribacter ferrooxidans]|uniref:Flagellar biosynthesis protein FliO n=1 Tax=Ciceribacter ferrooxidans TaxID=2509717 RepID=A0A4Q2T5J2_9HYPH|nr:flagellar biosynthetic protein FliO [Ciceribacter ferrooxidans]RYC12244.1 flagellar biosynthesis protein FliO [Ciceribacter ferrooxidans]